MAAQADGILVTAGQIYVSSLDAAPREQDVIAGVASIDAGEIVADEIETANLILSGELTTKLGSITSLTGSLAANIATIKKLGIGVSNPVNDFQIGENDVIVNTKADDLMVVNGNVVNSNMIARNIIKTENDVFLVNSGSINVVTVTGNTVTTNLTATNKIVVGPVNQIETVAQFKNGNVVVNNGNLLITGNINVTGNVSIDEDLTYRISENLIVSNAVIQMADGTPSGDYDNGLLMTVHQGLEPNVAIGYSVSNNEIIFAKTFGSARDIGSTSSGGIRYIPIDSNVVNIHVYGQLYTEGSVGVANINPAHTLSIGSNVYFEDSGSNVMHADGNVFIEKLQVGSGGFTSSGSLFQINPGSTVPVVFGANVQSDSIRTTGTFNSGIANTSPTDTLSVGDKVFMNVSSANVLTVVGNTVSTNVETDIVFSKGNLDVKALTGQLTLRTATDTSNTTSITMDGDTRQDVRFTTKNTERMRLTKDGKLGIANTNPSEALTVSGNVHVTGSNAVVYGTGGMRMYSVPSAGENRIENTVSSGKGLNFYASKTSTMGTAKMTILETGNVGIGSTQPQGILHTSGGTVFINDQPTNRNGYNHIGTPLVVSNTTGIPNDINDLGNVLEFTRHSVNPTSNAARVTFKLGKYYTGDVGSRSRMSISLADDSYSDSSSNILTLLANGKVGIGHTQPSAHLEIKSTGFGNPRENGLLVHNHDQGDAIIAVQSELDGIGNAFTSYIQTTGTIYSGWSSGVSGPNGDYRITKNHQNVKDSSNVSIFVDGATGNVGIGTDVARDNVELHGNVVIGNKLTFGGLVGDTYGNTVFLERSYHDDSNKNELIIYKGGKGPGAAQSSGPSRIRYLSSEHVFDTSGGLNNFTLSDLVDKGDFEKGRRFPLRITPTGLVAIHANSGDITNVGTGTKLFIGGNIEFGSGGSFTLSGFELLTTTGTVSRNIIRNKLNGTVKRPLTFTHQDTSRESDKEFARFDENGNLGIGTTTIGANVHIHNSQTTSSDVLKLTSNAAATGTTETGMLLYLDGADGGYVRGYHDKTNTRTGLILGATGNGTESNVMYLTNSSNVGIGTTNPTKKLHVVGDIQCGKVTLSNIHLDDNANIYANTTDIVLEGKPTTISNNLTVTGNLSIDGTTTMSGNVSLTNQSTNISGKVVIENGLVTCSTSVAHKTYAHSFSLDENQGKIITLNFSNEGLFYAKIIAMLTKSGALSSSTMVLEVQGGNGTSIGSKNIFGGTTDIWGYNVELTATSVKLTPQIGNSVYTTYEYDISVELISSKGVKLLNLKYNNDTQTLKTFSY